MSDVREQHTRSIRSFDDVGTNHCKRESSWHVNGDRTCTKGKEKGERKVEEIRVAPSPSGISHGRGGRENP